MSVIVARALPDARDGLKPVHRRILFAQKGLNNVCNRPYLKCARIVGDVIGKYHPHGDSAVYDALVRMAQDFSMRYTLVDGQGNFGSIDGDPPAAMRYTECRMSKLASEMLADIDKETVDWQPNYDDKEQEPTVLPTKVPNLLINGASGIAVGMATNIPPHNLGEIIDGMLALIENPKLTDDERDQIVPGPDFPTGGVIQGRAQPCWPAIKTRRVHEMYATAAAAYLRASARRGDPQDRPAIIVTELPFMVDKARWIETTADMVRDKKLEGISDIRDESDRTASASCSSSRATRRTRSCSPTCSSTPRCRRRSPSTCSRSSTAAPTLPLKRVISQLRHPPARDRPPPDRVRPREGTGQGAHPRGPQDRPRQPRRGDPHDPRVRGRGDRAQQPPDELRAVGAPGPGDPRHAARPPCRARAPEDRGRVPVGHPAHRRARGHPGQPGSACSRSSRTSSRS